MSKITKKDIKELRERLEKKKEAHYQDILAIQVEIRAVESFIIMLQGLIKK